MTNRVDDFFTGGGGGGGEVSFFCDAGFTRWYHEKVTSDTRGTLSSFTIITFHTH